MLHGGAGALDNIQTEAEHNLYQEHIVHILEQGRKLLEKGEKPLDLVTHCAALLEDDELFNAGAGSVLNEDGKVEMNAAIMDGMNLQAGSVAQISNGKRLTKSIVFDLIMMAQLIKKIAMRIYYQ